MLLNQKKDPNCQNLQKKEYLDLFVLIYYYYFFQGKKVYNFYIQKFF